MKIYLDEDRLPVIEPVLAAVAEKRDHVNMDNSKQVVMTITEEDWKVKCSSIY